jgi:hypothetical protein
MGNGLSAFHLTPSYSYNKLPQLPRLKRGLDRSKDRQPRCIRKPEGKLSLPDLRHDNAEDGLAGLFGQLRDIEL